MEVIRLTEPKKKPWLSETIDFDRDIEPYQFIAIYAGVGSGKNVFVDNLVLGNIFTHADGSPVSPKNILLISSRRAKIDEQLKLDNVVYDPAILNDVFASNPFLFSDPKYDNYWESPTITISSPEDWGSGVPAYARSCAFTNAKTEWYIAGHYILSAPTSHLWERFDMIIIDEAHSLLADASYQSSPFYVRRLIEETLARSSTCKVILMTGTPHILDGYPLLEKAHVIDRMEMCNNVVPKRVQFITKDEAKDMRETFLQQKTKFVAFMNHIDPILSLRDDFPNDVAISFSDLDRLDKLKKEKPAVYDKMLEVSRYLAKYKKLPDDVIAFLTTSRNKEGINIKNKDIHTMFVETHHDVDIVQMAGRLRNPADILYIVADSTDFHDTDSRFEAPFSEDPALLKTINDYFRRLCQKEDFSLDDECWTQVRSNKELADFIDFLHGKFPYIRFDYFTNTFQFYPERRVSKRYAARQNQLYQDACESRELLIQKAEQWFPGSECSVSRRVAAVWDVKPAVEAYLTEQHWLDENTVIKSKERAEILETIGQITGEPAKRLGHVLRRFGYQLKPLTKSKKADAPYRIVRCPNK